MYFVTTIGDIGLHSIIAGLVAFLAIQGFWFLFCKRPLKKLQHRMQETILLASFAFALLVQAIGHLLKVPDLAFALLAGFALGAITFLVITSPLAPAISEKTS
ncbi:MAG: hypothetical protein ACTHMT_01875 [Verrucomicrobiota bacterium]